MARRALLMLMFGPMLLAACGGNSPAPPAPAAPTAPSTATIQPNPAPSPTAVSGFGAGYISGRSSYADGRPLTGVKIAMRGTTSAGANVYFETDVDEKGHYAQKVPDGLYEIKAYVTAQYRNRTYGLWLDPIDGINTPSQYSGNDIIKDFVWKLSGPTPAAKTKPDAPQSYYGGIVEVGSDSEFEMQYNNGRLVDPHSYPAGSTIRLILTPDGPLADGSTGMSIEQEIDPQKITDALLRDIPLGDYKATAILMEENGKSTDLQVATIIPGGKIGDPVIPAQSAPIIFKPESFGPFGFQAATLYILPGK